MTLPAGRRSAGTRDRAVSALVGGILILLLTAALAGTVLALMPGLLAQEPAPTAGFEVTADPAENLTRLTHLAGDELPTDQTRIVWTVDGDRLSSGPIATGQRLAAGDGVTFVFDGVTGSGGAVPGYSSPGKTDIESGDELAVTVVDTGSESVVYRTTTTAGSVQQDLSVPTGGSLVQVGDDTAGASGVTVRVSFTIQPGSATIGNSLNSLEAEFASGSADFFSGTSQSDVTAVGVDTGGDAALEVDLASDVDAWTVTNGGSKLKVGFTGSGYTNPEAGDTVVLVLGGVSNPSTGGSYGVSVQTSGDGNWQSGTVEIT